MPRYGRYECRRTPDLCRGPDPCAGCVAWAERVETDEAEQARQAAALRALGIPFPHSLPLDPPPPSLAARSVEAIRREERGA